MSFSDNSLTGLGALLIAAIIAISSGFSPNDAHRQEQLQLAGVIAGIGGGYLRTATATTSEPDRPRRDNSNI